MTYLVQLTDTHIVPPGELLYDKVDTAAHLADAVVQVNAMLPQPDVVMISGDLVERPDAASYEHFRRLIEPIKAPVYLIPGNHDDPRAMLRHFGKSPMFPAVDPTCQYAIEDFDFRILALNSHLADSELPSFPAERLRWLEQALAQSDRPTLIAIHHPPMRTGVEFIDMVGEQWYAGIGSLLARHPQVRLVICGHGHTDILGCLGTVPVYMSGSTAHQLIAGRGNDHAPSFDPRPFPPVLHHWLGTGFASGTNPWPAWVERKRIDKESGLDWETLKDRMRGAKRG